MRDVRDCSQCSRPFPFAESWESKCLVCWKESKGYDLTKGDKAFVAMQSAYMSLAKQKTTVRTKEVRVNTGSLSPDRIKALIKLCHPDHHKGSEQAHSITVWLLAQRRKK